MGENQNFRPIGGFAQKDCFDVARARNMVSCVQFENFDLTMQSLQ